jgi:hypothetical protein
MANPSNRDDLGGQGSMGSGNPDPDTNRDKNPNRDKDQNRDKNINRDNPSGGFGGGQTGGQSRGSQSGDVEDLDEGDEMGGGLNKGGPSNR